MTGHRLLARLKLGMAAITLPLLVDPGLAQARSLILGMDARDVGSLDPAFTKTGSDEFMVRQLFNTLVSPPDGTLQVGLNELQGELAESWTVSADGKAWTFKLRPGIKWQKGYGEVSAEDVKFSFERQMDPKSEALYASNYGDIERIEVTDARTVVFHLKQPSAFFHVNALMPRFGGFIVSKKAVEERGRDHGLNPIGTGPFQFEGYSSKQNIVASANPDYFGGEQKVDGLEFRFVPDGNARTVALIGGELDLIEGVREPGWSEKVQQRYPDAILDALFPGSIQTVFLNMTKPPLDNLKVRQAMAHSLNPAAWAKAFGVLHQPLWGVAPEQFYGGLKEADVPAELRYSYDPERAKQLLAEAGFPDGVTISAYASERGDYKTNTLLLQDHLRKVGIDLDVRFVDHPTYHADNYKDTNTVVTISTTQPPNVIPVLRTFYASDAIVTKASGGGRNYSHYGEVAGSIDQALAAAEVETDAGKQLGHLHDIQLQILKDLPVLRLQGLGVLWVRQPWVKLPYEPEAGLGHYSLAGVTLAQ